METKTLEQLREHLTEYGSKLLLQIQKSKKTPFKKPLRYYISELNDNPICHICERENQSGVEVGKSPEFNRKWFYGEIVCLHICHACYCRGYEETQKWLKEVFLNARR